MEIRNLSSAHAAYHVVNASFLKGSGIESGCNKAKQL